MPQIHIHLDEDLLDRIRAAAEERGCSISDVIAERLRAGLPRTGDWPEGYFENVIGSLADAHLKRPDQPDWSADGRRESI